MNEEHPLLDAAPAMVQPFQRQARVETYRFVEIPDE
jgi:hypothetical protein